MNATIKIEFLIDGKNPGKEGLTDAIYQMISRAGYIGSEQVDGSDEWGVEINSYEVEVE
jgi:hypothetical protein